MDRVLEYIHTILEFRPCNDDSTEWQCWQQMLGRHRCAHRHLGSGVSGVGGFSKVVSTSRQA